LEGKGRGGKKEEVKLSFYFIVPARKKVARHSDFLGLGRKGKGRKTSKGE